MFLIKLRGGLFGLTAVVLFAAGAGAVLTRESAADDRARGATTPARSSGAAAPTGLAGKGTPPVRSAGAVAPKADAPAWKKEFDTIYGLAAGELIRRVAPPYRACREEFLKDYSAGVTPSSQWFSTFRQKDGKIWCQTRTLPVTPETGVSVRDLLNEAVDIPLQEIDGEKAVLGLMVTGDFVRRDDADPVKVVARLQEILQKDCKLGVKMAFREVEREAVVASGKWKITPVAGREKNHVEFYARELTDPSRGSQGGADTVPNFFRHLSAFVDSRIVNESECDPKMGVSWHCNERGLAEDRDLTAVLKNVSDQTGLRFKFETRKVQVLFVEKADEKK